MLAQSTYQLAEREEVRTERSCQRPSDMVKLGNVMKMQLT